MPSFSDIRREISDGTKSANVERILSEIAVSSTECQHSLDFSDDSSSIFCELCLPIVMRVEGENIHLANRNGRTIGRIESLRGHFTARQNVFPTKPTTSETK